MHTRVMPPQPTWSPPPRPRPGAGWFAAATALCAAAALLFLAAPTAPRQPDSAMIQVDPARQAAAAPTTVTARVTRSATLRALPAYPGNGRIQPDLTLPEYGEQIAKGTVLTFDCRYDGAVVGAAATPSYPPEQPPPAKPGSNQWYRLHQPDPKATPDAVHLVLPQAWLVPTTPHAIPAPCPDDESGYDPGWTQAEVDQCKRNLVAPYECAVVWLAAAFATNNDNIIAAGEFKGDSRTDAARHCLLQLYIAAFIDPATAQRWGDAHEHAPGTLKSHEMDQHNNRVARSLVTDRQLQQAMANRPLATGHLRGSQPRQRIQALCEHKIRTSKRVTPQAKPWPANTLIYFDPDTPIPPIPTRPT